MRDDYYIDQIKPHSLKDNFTVGQSLYIQKDSEDPDGNGALSYSWQISTNGQNWEEVSTSSTYEINKSDEGKSIKAVISYKDDKGVDERVPTSSFIIPYVNDGQASFSIDGTVAVKVII